MLLINLPEGPVLAAKATLNDRPYPYITIEKGVSGSYYYWQVDTNNDHDLENQYDVIACNVTFIKNKHYCANKERIQNLPRLEISDIAHETLLLKGFNIDQVYECEAVQVDNVFIITKINE